MDLFTRNMTFNDIAIDDGCMAGAKLIRKTVTPFELGYPAGVLVTDGEACFLEMVAPALATASAGCLVNQHVPGVVLTIGDPGKCHERRQETGQDQ